jgi:outer membrane protein assembly factor BamB
VLWTHEYDCAYSVSYAAGPRCTPLVDGDRVHTLGAEGHLLCLDVTTGKVLELRDFRADYGANPTWGFAGHPLLGSSRLVCLVGAKAAWRWRWTSARGRSVALTLTAKERLCSPTLISTPGEGLIVGTESVNALNPRPANCAGVSFESRAGLNISTPRLSGDRFITTFYSGSLLLRLTTGNTGPLQQQEGQRRTPSSGIIPAPFIEDGHIYGVCSYGQLRCLNLATGERV